MYINISLPFECSFLFLLKGSETKGEIQKSVVLAVGLGLEVEDLLRLIVQQSTCIFIRRSDVTLFARDCVADSNKVPNWHKP